LLFQLSQLATSFPHVSSKAKETLRRSSVSHFGEVRFHSLQRFADMMLDDSSGRLAVAFPARSE
jgi:hypothetical protein